MQGIKRGGVQSRCQDPRQARMRVQVGVPNAPHASHTVQATGDTAEIAPGSFAAADRRVALHQGSPAGRRDSGLGIWIGRVQRHRAG